MRHQSRRKRRGPGRFIIGVVVIIVAAAVGTGIFLHNRSTSSTGGPLPVQLPAATGAYLGVYTHGLPDSYSGVAAFNSATQAKPDVVMYYSGWYVPFPSNFATTVANNGAVPLVQMDPDNISVSQIASGRYDGYLSAYAEAVRAYRHPVVMSFGHEMNGTWYTWGYKQTPPAVFVAAWRQAGILTHERFRKWRRVMLFGVFLIAGMANPSPDPITMLILGGACAALVEVAEFIVWSNDRRRARACVRTRTRA